MNEIPGHGLVLMACPGTSAGRDVAAIRAAAVTELGLLRQRGVETVVTLVEQATLDRLGLADLGLLVRAAGLTWHHLPIADFSVPDAAFEADFGRIVPDLHARLAAGEKLAIHCRAGIGRTGTIAARILIERGVAAPEAIAMVRRARSGAIETEAQLAYVGAVKPL